jgi:hypothetical protein
MYKVEKDKNTQFFHVIELGTEQVIFKHSIYADAYKVYRFMKDGGAFHGWTPSFVINTATNQETA